MHRKKVILQGIRYQLNNQTLLTKKKYKKYTLSERILKKHRFGRRIWESSTKDDTE